MTRIEAWNKAAELVDPIIETHVLEQYSPGANIFTNGTTVCTKVDQHIDHIINVAEWLMKEE